MMPLVRCAGGSLRQASAITTALSPPSRMSMMMICPNATQKGVWVRKSKSIKTPQYQQSLYTAHRPHGRGWSPAPANMQRQIHRHAHHQGAQNAAAHKKVHGGAQHGGQACIQPGADELAVVHDDFRRHHRRQRGQRRVAQPALEPLGQRQIALGDQEKGAGDDRHHGQSQGGHPAPQPVAAAIDHGWRSGTGVGAGAVPAASRGKGSTGWRSPLLGSGGRMAGLGRRRSARRWAVSISSPAAMAAAMATRMLSLSGRPNAATAAAAATAVATEVARSLTIEYNTPNRANTPAKPSPHSSGMRWARKIPANAPSCHDSQLMAAQPQEYGSCSGVLSSVV